MKRNYGWVVKFTFGNGTALAAAVGEPDTGEPMSFDYLVSQAKSMCFDRNEESDRGGITKVKLTGRIVRYLMP